jgi:RNA polymerase sigma factor (sigma-70 family)
VTRPAFDPAAASDRVRHLERRLAAAVHRIGDPATIARVAGPLTAGGAAELFLLLCDEDPRVSAAAHECAMLHYGWLAAVAAEAFGFDAHTRDDLVQRTFLDLPRVVRRAAQQGAPVTHPEGWLRRRAYLIARQMLREEHGRPVVDAATRAPSYDGAGRVARTRGTRVPIEALDADPDGPTVPADAAEALMDREAAELVHDALRALAVERPWWARLLRLHYFDGHPLDEIARQVGRSHGTVRNDARSARLRLRAIIRARDPDAGRRHD